MPELLAQHAVANTNSANSSHRGIAEREGGVSGFVTHQIEEAVCLSDRVIVITKPPGPGNRIMDIGLRRPRDYDMRIFHEFNELRPQIWYEPKNELNSRGDD